MAGDILDYYVDDYYVDDDGGPETDLSHVDKCPKCGSADVDINEDCGECGGSGLVHDSQGDGPWETSMTLYCPACDGYGGYFVCLECGLEMLGDGTPITKPADTITPPDGGDQIPAAL